MIVIYPMLTSTSVSPNVLPGIIKAVEKYILLYNADEVLKVAGMTNAGQIISTGAKAVAGAGAVLGTGLAAGAISKRLEPGTAKQALDVISKRFGENTLFEAPNSITKVVNKVSKDVEKQVKNTKYGNPSLDIPSKSDAISLEPTWMTVTTKYNGAQILGVKVVPFRIKSPEPIIQMLTQDKKLKTLDYLSARYGRLFTRVFSRTMRKVKLPFIKGTSISGDPKQDILYGKTQYGENMFICMSELDIDNSEIFSSPRDVQKVQKLGWSSMVITDDVNRRATFCMKEFGGICSVVPYNYMFASMGKDINQAYEDLEDLKKSSSPFFNRSKTNRKKVFSEGLRTVDKYLGKIQE